MRSALFILVILCFYTECAKILGVFPAPGYSQFILGEALMTELAERNHDVTVISPYKPTINLPNYRTISTEALLDHFKEVDYFKMEDRNFMTTFQGSHNTGLKIAEFTLSVPDVQDLLHSNNSFDLVIVEQFFSNALMGFAKFFDAPLIVFSSIGPSEWTNSLMGHILLPSVMPITKLTFSTRMTFLQRLKNTAAYFFDVIYKHYVVYPNQEKILQKHFPKMMNLEDVMNNVSLLLLNSQYSITEPFPLVTGMIEIGGFHIKDGNLPANIQQFLDDATYGAIYFSMGTNLKMSLLDERKIRATINVFAKLKQRILWKFDQPMSTLPPNVMVARWLPQNAVLAHPKIKLFISHVGLLSTTEAVHFGVPMIGIPIFGDQKMNTARAVDAGFAACVPLTQLNEETLYHAVTEVLENSKYKDNVRKRSALYHDQVVKPLDLAMYWIEHVIRNKGGNHLKFAGAELKWYQFYLLDVLGFCTFILTVVICSLICLIRKCLDFRRSRKIKVN